MKIGLLQCDDVADALQAEHGNYPDMIRTLLQAADPRVDLEVYACHQGHIPDKTNGIDGWITTGSKCGANDDVDWIAKLSEFIRTLWQTGQPLVGICFGHQLMAKALGGRVERSENGWGIGAYPTTLQQAEPWMTPWRSKTLQLLASHQDQVVEPPPQTRILAQSGFCPIYMMQVGEHFLGIQGHPEFTRAYLSDLLRSRHDRIDPQRLQAAWHSLRQDVYDTSMAHWILNFIRRAPIRQSHSA